MVGKKWDNVDRTVLRGSLTERNLARMCAQKRAFLLPARSQLQKDNSQCHRYRRLAGKMPISQRGFTSGLSHVLFQELAHTNSASSPSVPLSATFGNRHHAFRSAASPWR